MENLERYTENARRALACAQECARELKQTNVDCINLLLGLMRTDGSRAAQAMKACGIEYNAVLAFAFPKENGESFTTSLGFTPYMRKILELSAYEARSAHADKTGTEHILLALIGEKKSGICDILHELDVDSTKLKSLLRDKFEYEIVNLNAAKATGIKSEIPTLLEYGVDISKRAEQKLLDPVIGREQELLRVIQILLRRNKNNPILIGEPGVGKSAIVEGLAQSIAGGSVPKALLSKRIVSIDMGSVIAGTKYRGDFEQRLQNIINEATSDDNIILFIDEIHGIVGTGASEGALDAANLLKPALARGNLRLIGATTIDEYKKTIEKDAALERRFQPVLVSEPTEIETLQILMGLRSRYETHHGLLISDDALNAAVELSAKYIQDRKQPDKALDLLDEAASKVSMRTQIEKSADLGLHNFDMLRREKKEAIAAQDYEKAILLRDKERNLCQLSVGKRASTVTVERSDIAQVVKDWTGIPAGVIDISEQQRLLMLEDILKKKIVGQNEAISAATRALKRAKVGLGDLSRPMGSLLFMGPVGCGKTELAKILAATLFGDEHALIRLDMSEYMEPQSVSRLIGAPPGYAGFSDGGQLTERVRRNPYCAILFDEIEKAHPDVLNLLLQILEEGRLTDSSGRTVNLKNTLIMLTSNIGAAARSSAVGFESKGDVYEGRRAIALDELKKAIRPELVNRIDEIIVFNELTKDDLAAIAANMFANLARKLKPRGLKLEIKPGVCEWLANLELHMGARPLRRNITRYIEDPLSDLLLRSQANAGMTAVIKLVDGKIVIETK